MNDEQVFENLMPIFPNLTGDVIWTSVSHPSNRAAPCNTDTVLQRCIDDLLDLRTFKSVSSDEADHSVLIGGKFFFKRKVIRQYFANIATVK